MFGLGLRLALNSGREALTRLLLTMVSVSIGVAILLAVLADFHAFQASNSKPNWEETVASQNIQSNDNVELWNYSNDIYKGQTIKRLDIAALGPNAPVLPGISKLPAAGQYYVSPALDRLLQKTPANQLGERFQGKQSGIIGDQALNSPDDLVVFIGRSASDLAPMVNTIKVNKLSVGPQSSVWTGYFRYAFGIGAVAFVFPIVVLIGVATRMAAERREERYAALRLIGASTRQISVIASIDAIAGAFLGALLGIGVFLALRSAWADTTILNNKFFAYDVTPTALGYASLLVAVPVISAAAALISLRRIRISPLGVSRKVTPKPPRFWRVIPLLLGIAMYVVGVLTTDTKNIGAMTYPGLLVIMIGLIYGGPWLTMQAARLLSKTTRGTSTLLAARRLADDPKAAFRSVSGLVLAVFLGTMVAGLLPVVNATMKTPSANALNNVLYDSFTYGPVCGNSVNCTGGKALKMQPDGFFTGLSPQSGAKLISELQAFPGVAVAPVYKNPLVLPPGKIGPDQPPAQNSPQSFPSILPCGPLAKIAAFGTCAHGAQYVYADASNLQSDNPTYSTQAFVDATNPAAPSDTTQLRMESMLVKVNDATTLEQVRTFLATHVTDSASGAAPRTFGEAVQARSALTATIQRLFFVAIALTLFVAGCSLAVAVGGGIVERKRPFSLLRITGVQMSTLYKVVILEGALPLITAMVVAAGLGYGISLESVSKVAPKGTPIPGPSTSYYIIMGAGLVVSLLVILVTLPILRYVTQPDNARFE